MEKIATTFIQQPNLHCLLFFDASCKTGNKSAQGQSIKGKKINCTRTNWRGKCRFSPVAAPHQLAFN